MTEEKKVRALQISLRVWGITSLFIFVPLFIGFITKTSLLKEGTGILNWSIWNDDVCAGPTGECHVPAMLFAIYITWSVFSIIAARKPREYLSFLNFSMWGNIVHAALMTFQVFSELDRYWSKFLTDIPWILSMSLAIYFFRPGKTDVAPDAGSGTRLARAPS